MTKTRSTKSALMSSVLALVLCFTMLLGTTFAWFTDSVTSANNIIKSGNLDVELYYQAEGQTDWTKVTDTTNVFKENALWEPGHTEVVKLKVVNEGTLALKYQLGVNVASEVGSVNVNDVAFKLSDFIKFGIVDGAQSYTRDQAIAAVDATATALKTAYNSTITALDAKNDTDSDEKIVTMVVYMPTTVGNDANAKTGAAVPTINLGINLFATQMTAESDSFNDQYDKDAEFSVDVKNADDLADAIANGKTAVSLSNDIALNTQLEVNGELTIVGNGNTITAPANGTRVVNVMDNTEDVTVTLVGVKLDAADKERGISFYNNSGDLDVTIIDCEITANYYGVNVASQNDKATLNIKDSTLTGYCAFQTHSPNTVATFDNCVLEGVNKWYNNAEYPTANNFATIVVNSLANNSTLTFNNCTIIATEQESATAPAGQWSATQAHIEDNATGTTINWNNCTFIKNGVEVNAPESIN